MSRKLRIIYYVEADAGALARRAAQYFVEMVDEAVDRRGRARIAISGGSTPKAAFELLSDPSQPWRGRMQWEKLEIFWVDERCIPDTSFESNFGNAYRILFSKVKIPPQNLHYARGSEDPVNEVVRYTGEILTFVPFIECYPCFDLLFLGLGNDGHTASIFPGQANLFETSSICTISIQPETNQKRITLTGKSINNAPTIVFLVFGKNKADIIKSLFSNDPDSYKLPAKKIHQKHGKLSWYLDNEASIYINIKQ